MIAYGPVPSRRLGRSLGINNIPPKSCTYACAYCQVGRTLDMGLERREFYRPVELVRSVANRIDAVTAAGETIDYLSFVPDGEPTLDLHLGEEIALLRELGRPVAVISNASLLDRTDVRAELAKADWVSLKVDTVDEATWRRLNRPHRALDLPSILDGMIEFGREFAGTLVTETMLVAGINDTERSAASVAEFLSRLRPSTAYLAVPTRPPALDWAIPPGADALMRGFGILESMVANVEYLLGYEGNVFTVAGDPAENLLGITAVHPMREDAVTDLLAKTGVTWDLVEQLIEDGRLQRVEYAGHSYYLRRPGGG